MSVRAAAPAKVNLALHVLGKREDGFHEIRTLFQALDLGDELRLERGGRGVELDVRGPDLGPIEENLAYRAAELFLEASGETRGVRIELTKWIPAGAGLGGGSSDAAAVLKMLSSMSPFPAAPGDLMGLGARLGSDVPFFLCPSPLARAAGRGERLTPLRTLPARDVVLALPRVHVSTAEAYAALDRPALPAGASEPARADPPTSWRELLADRGNDFEPVVAERHPEVRRSLDALRDAGAGAVSLSGSGGACFGFFPDRATAERAADALTLELEWPFVAARTLTEWAGPSPDPGLVGGWR